MYGIQMDPESCMKIKNGRHTKLKQLRYIYGPLWKGGGVSHVLFSLFAGAQRLTTPSEIDYNPFLFRCDILEDQVESNRGDSQLLGRLHEHQARLPTGVLRHRLHRL